MPSVTAPTPSASSRPPVSPVADTTPFGVYVHWPFCLAKCPYCDFNSHVRESVDQARWARALCAEIDHYADQTGRRPAASVFFGGGTPSLMDPSTVAAVLARIDDRWGLTEETEITLEANPTSVEAGRFADYAAAGVNRFSLGIQALHDADLAALGRRSARRQSISTGTTRGCGPWRAARCGRGK